MDLPWRGLVDSADPAGAAGPGDPLVGAVLVRDVDLPEALRSQALRSAAPLRVVSTGGAGALAGPLRLAARAGVRLAGLQTTLRDRDDPVGNARRVVAALDAAADEGVLPDDLAVVVEAPAAYGVERVLDVLAERELVWGLRLPTPSTPAAPGGPATPGEVVDPAAVAGWLDAALDRETPYVVTGGLRRAVGDAGEVGYLSLLAATRLAFDGVPARDALVERSAAALLAIEGLAGARRWFRSFVGSPVEVHAELVELGLTTAAG